MFNYMGSKGLIVLKKSATIIIDCFKEVSYNNYSKSTNFAT